MIINRDGHGPDGRRLYFFDLGGGNSTPAPAAPDYTAIAAANDKAAQLGYDTSANQLAFNKQVYADQQPYIKQLEDSATKTAAQDAQIASDNQSHANTQWDEYQKTFVPVEQQVASDAMNYGTAADQEQQAGTAANTVNTQFQAQRDQAQRQLESMGVRPDSGAAMAASAGQGAAEAAASANAANTARTSARDKGISLRAGAADFGRNMPNSAAGAYSGAVTASSAGTGNLSTAANAPLAGAGLVNSGYGAGMQAAGLGSSSALGMGGVLNTGYGIATQGWGQQQQANAQSDAGMGSLIGGLGMMGAKMMIGSSKEFKHNKHAICSPGGLKHDKTPVEGGVVDKLDAVPVEEWTYNKGIADEGTHIGPYAEDMNQQFGDVAAPEGKAIDMITTAGLHHAAIQELSSRIKRLEAVGIRRST